MQFVGIDHPAAAGAHDLLGIRIKGGDPHGRGRFDGEDHPGTGLVAEARDDGNGAATRRGDPALDAHLFDAGAGSHRGDLGLQGSQLIEIGIDLGPDVHPDMIGVHTVRARRQAAARSPDRFEALGQGALDMRQAGDPAGVITRDRELTHLRHGHEPLVIGVLPADAMQQQHILRGIEPGQGEVPQPPQIQPASDHGVHIAHRQVLDQAAVRLRPQRHVADLVRRIAHHADRNAAQRAHEGQRRQQGREFGRRRVAI